MEREAARQDTNAGRYRVLKRLASGSSGEVLSASDESTGKAVALKRQLQQGHCRATRLSLQREYHALSGLRHPRIIEVYDYGMDRLSEDRGAQPELPPFETDLRAG